MITAVWGSAGQAPCQHKQAVNSPQVDFRARGHDHYFNLEYDAAIEDYRRLLAAEPSDLGARNHMATALLYKELLRLGMLETSAFKGDNDFLQRDKPRPDPAVRESFESLLAQGRKHALAALSRAPGDAEALYSLSNSHALEANYQFMVDKAYFAALRNGRRAEKYSKKLRKTHADFVDAYLIGGVQQYVLGSLPWPIKVLAAVGGMRGDKAKGEAWVRRVAEHGNYARHHARSLLAILLRRERRPLEAAAMLEGLRRDFPRNYVLSLELGSMYLDAREDQLALDVFREAREKQLARAPGYARMPARTVRALDRRITRVEETLHAAGGE